MFSTLQQKVEAVPKYLNKFWFYQDYTVRYMSKYTWHIGQIHTVTPMEIRCNLLSFNSVELLNFPSDTTENKIWLYSHMSTARASDNVLWASVKNASWAISSKSKAPCQSYLTEGVSAESPANFSPRPARARGQFHRNMERNKVICQELQSWHLGRKLGKERIKIFYGKHLCVPAMAMNKSLLFSVPLPLLSSQVYIWQEQLCACV